jgi:hypothetical protein
MGEQLGDASIRRRMFGVAMLTGVALFNGGSAAYTYFNSRPSPVIQERVAQGKDPYLQGAADQLAFDRQSSITWDGGTAAVAGLAAVVYYAAVCRRRFPAQGGGPAKNEPESREPQKPETD